MIFDQFKETYVDAVARFLAPVGQFFSGYSGRWFAGYLLGFVVFSIIVVMFRNYDRELTLRANLKSAVMGIFPRNVILHQSARLDYRYAIINHFITSAALVYLLVAINVMSGFFYDIFSALPLIGTTSLTLGWVGAVLIIFLYAFAYDTMNFFQHWIQHKVPLLWEFHKVHHSAEVLTPVTVVRVHPVALCVAATSGAVVYGCLNGLTYNLFEGEAARYSLLGANMFAFLFYTIGLYNFKHSHIWITYPKFIKEIFASPSLHLIHHSNNPIHYDKNFGFVFTFWDRLFGIYYDPQEEDQVDLTLGIS